MKNAKLLIIAICALSLLGIYVSNKTPKSLRELVITQIVEHATLDQVRISMLDYLASIGYVDGVNIKIVYHNAQGNTVNAAQIAKHIISSHPAAVVAISTPSAQSILAARDQAEIPIVFTAVTDPLKANLVENLNSPGIGVSGVTDKLDAKQQILMIKKFVPNLKTLGTIFNPGEINSVQSYQDLLHAAREYGIELIDANAINIKDVSTAAQSLVGRVDAIYVPNDNVAVSAMPYIVQVGITSKIPVFAGDTGSVQNGAIAAMSYSPAEIGRATGKIVAQYLDHGYGEEIPVVYDLKPELSVNTSSAEKMGVKIPSSEDIKLHTVQTEQEEK